MSDGTPVEISDAPVAGKDDFSGAVIDCESDLLAMTGKVVENILNVGKGADEFAVDLENLVELADAEGGARYEGLRRAAGMR